MPNFYCESESSDSADNEDMDGIDRAYLPEKLILKSSSKGEDSDQWPEFLMEDVTIYKEDGVTIANLLDVEIEGTLIARGRLNMRKTETEWNLLKKKSYKTAHIEITSQSFSIGHLPTTIWAEGASGWFEIQPSALYKNMYTKMAQGVEIYFSVVQAYEDVKKSMKMKKGWATAMTVDEVLARYALMDCTGLFQSEILARVKEHAQFLLLHMLKGESIPLKVTTFYQWLTREFPEIYGQIQEKSRRAVEAPTGTRETRILPPPQKYITTPSSESEHNENLSSRKRFSSFQEEVEDKPTTRKSRSSKERTGAFVKELQLIPTEIQSIADVIVQLMNEAVTKGRFDRQKISTATLWGMLYRDYSLRDPQDCKIAVEVAAPSIMANLSNEWKDTDVYEDLDELTQKPGMRENISAKLKEILQGEGLKERVRTTRVNSKPVARSKTSNSNANLGEPSTHPNTRPSTRSASAASRMTDQNLHRGGLSSRSSSRRSSRPSTRSASAASESLATSSRSHAAKSLPPSQAAQPTGKRAGLRLVRSTLKRTTAELSAQLNEDEEEDDNMDDFEYVNDPYTSLRKRARNPEWDTIGSQYIDGVTAEESPFFVTNGEREHEESMKNPGYELVSQALPSLTATGPLGSWVCQRQDCPFIERNPETLEGGDAISVHLRAHVTVEERRSLTLKEGTASRTSVENLLEKLAKEGRKNQELQKSINGKPVQKRPNNRGRM